MYEFAPIPGFQRLFSFERKSLDGQIGKAQYHAGMVELGAAGIYYQHVTQLLNENLVGMANDQNIKTGARQLLLPVCHLFPNQFAVNIEQLDATVL